MAKISTYGIDAAPTLNDKVIGTRVEDNNNTYNYQFGDIYDLFQAQGGGGLGFVPYIDATNDVDLGTYDLSADKIYVNEIHTNNLSQYLTIGDGQGISIDNANDIFYIGDYSGLNNKPVFYVSSSIDAIGSTYAGNDVGLSLTFLTKEAVLGDYGLSFNGTKPNPPPPCA